MLCDALKSSGCADVVVAAEVDLDYSAPLAESHGKAFVGSKKNLAENISRASKESLLKPNPHVPVDHSEPICTSLFDLFKIGPGPSSSHTIGPMKAAFDFLQDVRQLFGDSSLSPDARLKFKVEVHLHGSLSLTGRGHKTDTAIVGGMLGWLPQTCDPDALVSLMTEPGQLYHLPICTSLSESGSELGSATKRPNSPPLRQLPDAGKAAGQDRFSDSEAPTPTTIGDRSPLGDDEDDEQSSKRNLRRPLFFPVDEVAVGADNIIWHAPEEAVAFPHPNTMIVKLVDDEGKCWVDNEYYSVGGGFIQKKGAPPEDNGVGASPKHLYRSMNEFKEILARNPNRTWPELMMENECAVTGCTPDEVNQKMDEILNAMESAVSRGIKARGMLPGTIGLQRRAGLIYERAKKEAFKSDSFLTFLNAYAQAASEENADGRIAVTAPTLGSSGVFPGLIYFMRHHLFYPIQVLRDAMMVAGCIGFLVKRNASISGAEMGCMGEVGVASCMGAAMLTYAAGGNPCQCEAAAEIALEAHLGVTCDPIGGYVQIPCIQRNPMGAVKAYNAYVLAMATDPALQKISLDLCIDVMRETGEDMSSKYKETSKGGLALHFPC
eukprot:Gregarina_sp_Poly_1__4529@NODE_2430_length_2145_cov_1059_989413_g1544_i0_p1_GENE_NODE_2430_length_2145_cov_1059_989413_g1544_i0NODE_2430_length_2145_cov_1059_989413_g1544_i0_p1_ORF_typecomplete_len607_score99_83SDH_alpha/PF03313_15/2_1e78SDH_beta/PF03315_15/7_1e38_NODE_2430_length_2145_cov_1059_989413_g1544_i02232043